MNKQRVNDEELVQLIGQSWPRTALVTAPDVISRLTRDLKDARAFNARLVAELMQTRVKAFEARERALEEAAIACQEVADKQGPYIGAFWAGKCRDNIRALTDTAEEAYETQVNK